MNAARSASAVGEMTDAAGASAVAIGLHLLAERERERFRPEGAAEVGGSRQRILQEAIHGRVDRTGRGPQFQPPVSLRQPVEEHSGREDKRYRVGAILPRDVGGGSVLRLREAMPIARVDRR